MRGPMMLGVVAALVVVGAVGGSGGVPPRHNELAGYTFGRYMEDFGKGYERGTAEYARRERLFLREVEAVRRHNAGGRATYKKGVNRYSDWTVEEKRRLRGVVGVGGARGAMGVGAGVPVHPAVGAGPLPRSVDYRTAQPAVLTAVKDQGRCGSCWAHAAVESIESHSAIATGRLLVLSLQQVTSCTPNPHRCGGSGGCDGATAELAFEYVTRSWSGLVQEWEYPYESYAGKTMSCDPWIFRSDASVHLSGYVAVSRNDAVAMQDVLSRVGPLAISVDAGDWPSYETGVYDGCSYSRNISMDHAVQLVGYGTDNATGQPYWLIRNSWSAMWGEAGYIRVARYPQGEPCGWNVNPQNGDGCLGETAPERACGMCGIAYDALYPRAKRKEAWRGLDPAETWRGRRKVARSR